MYFCSTPFIFLPLPLICWPTTAFNIPTSSLQLDLLFVKMISKTSLSQKLKALHFTLSSICFDDLIVVNDHIDTTEQHETDQENHTQIRC